MISQELDREEYQACIAIVLLIQHVKTNTFGKMQHVGFFRNKDVHLCPVEAVALCLFERFHVEMEPPPSFESSKH
ncbi:Transposable element [Phytophthora megakarya]|uniref:Transposable element n=1 Tax=Phytophthora megakarya TaxID=4795 RepID=A0A225WFM1_9STRA|nr:Transposable element [Phytophthora megakarya]